MKKISVYLGMLAPPHPTIEELVNYPPQGVVYKFPKRLIKVSKEKITKARKRKRGGVLFNLLNLLRLPNFRVYWMNTDLIHTWDFLALTRKPWVVDFEHVTALVDFHHKRLRSSVCKKIIKNAFSSKCCKKITPRSIAAKKSMAEVIDISEFQDKIEVVYPAVHVIKFKRRKEGMTRLLFVGRRFYEKGGRETLEAFKAISRKYDVELTMISNIPEKIKEKNKNVKNLSLLSANIPRKELFEKYYPNADIFVMPTCRDPFGLVFLEAMCFELPIVSTRIFAAPEIVEDGKNGFLVEPPINTLGIDDVSLYKSEMWINFLNKVPKPIVNELAEKLSILIEDFSLRRKMGRNGRELVERGKFSIAERNRKLRRIYEEALE